jgi:hypothetical protein
MYRLAPPRYRAKLYINCRTIRRRQRELIFIEKKFRVSTNKKSPRFYHEMHHGCMMTEKYISFRRTEIDYLWITLNWQTFRPEQFSQQGPIAYPLSPVNKPHLLPDFCLRERVIKKVCIILLK